MNSKIRFIEVFFMLLVILSFAATGMMILRGKQGGRYSGDAYGEDMLTGEYGDPDGLGDMGGFAGEGVGNMRVYQRGEQIDYADSEED